MRNILITLLLLSIGSAAMAQNIVPNPTFAIFDQCPDGPSQINRCKYWRAPTVEVSTEYFHECNDTLTGGGGYGVPSNVGYQESASGSYIGLFTYVDGDAREYAATDIPALVPGASYQVTMMVSLIDVMGYATDGLGVYFYNNKKPDTNSVTNIVHTPQIDYTWYGVITNKINWVRLVDTFVADSAYQHMVIGCFKSNAAITKVLVDATGPEMSYYYIDSVAVEKLPGSAAIVNKNQKSDMQARIYPQPFTDRAVLDIANVPATLEYELNLYNVQGAHVRSISGLHAGQTTIYRDGLPSGMYFYEVHTQGKATYRGKLMVE